MRNRALIRAKMVRSFGAKPGDYVFITKVKNIHIVSNEPINKSKRIKVDKYFNIRFDVKSLPNNVAIFNDNIVLG
jgi:hypothetical protein